MTRSRLGSALLALALLGVYACGGDGIVLPNEGDPATIAVIAGDGQIGPAGGTLEQALVVEVKDGLGRPVANQDVEFEVTEGGGQIDPATERTDASGRASATWTLGPGAGPQRARAQAVGNNAPANLTVSLLATALAGSGSTLVLESGDNQSGAVGTALDQPLVVRVVDPLGNPVSGQTVSWSVVGGGSIDPASSVTGNDGIASAERVLGPSAGTQQALATAEGLAGSPITFTHTAGASSPTSLVSISGDGQSAPAGFQLPESLVVRLLDANGNGVAGRTVTWVVAASAGVVDPVNSQTDVDGFAVTRWTLGASAGNYTLNAVFSGLPSVSFSATATADAPSTLALASGDNQSAPVGSALPQPLRVLVTDANGNPVENVSVTWAAASGGGSVSSSTTGTNAQGIAEVTRTLGPTPGANTTTASVGTLSGSPVTFTSTGVVGAPSRLAFLTQPTGAVVGQTIPAFQVEVQDAQGNRVPGANNQVTITSSVAGTLIGDNTENAADGVATFGGLALDEARTGYRLTARASGLANALSESFDIAQGSTTVQITGRNPSSSVAGQSVTISYRVQVVAPAAGGPTGTVTVSDGTQSCTGGVNAGTGVGNCSIALATAGDHSLTATYSGDGNFNGSVSDAQTHTVAKANTNVSITGDDPDPSAVGEQITVEYAVSVSSPGGGTPSGNVVITVSGGGETCTGATTAGSCTLTLTALGSRTLTATYAGDADYNGDTDTESHTVRAATTTAVSSSAVSTVFGESVTFTATVSPVAPATGTPSGQVQFRADGNNIGGPQSLNGSGVATVSTGSLAVGSHVITAEYLGGGSFAGSSGTLSPNHPVTAAQTNTTITNQSPISSNPGESYEVTVSVQPIAPGGGTPSGSFSVSDGEGGSCTGTLGGSGTGSCTLSSATPGTKTLTATYDGSTNHAGSTDTALHEVNTPPTAVGDNFSVGAALPTNVGAPGVLANDGDADGDGIQAVLDSDPPNGAVLLFASGGFLYTPNPLFVGTDSFTYHVTDGQASSATVTVTVQVGP